MCLQWSTEQTALLPEVPDILREKDIKAQHSVVKTVNHRDVNELWEPGGGDDDCWGGRAYSREHEEETLGMFRTKGRV